MPLNVIDPLRFPVFLYRNFSDITVEEMNQNPNAVKDYVSKFSLQHADRFFNPLRHTFLSTTPNNLEFSHYKYWTIWSHAYTVEEWTEIHAQSFSENHTCNSGSTNRYHDTRVALVKDFIKFLRDDPEFVPAWLLMFAFVLDTWGNIGRMMQMETSIGDNRLKRSNFDNLKQSVKNSLNFHKERQTTRPIADIYHCPIFEQVTFLRLVHRILANGRVYRTNVDVGGYSAIRVNEVKELLTADRDNNTLTVENTDYINECYQPFKLKVNLSTATTSDAVRRNVAKVYPYSTDVTGVLGRTFPKADKENKPTFYGVELELTTSYTPFQMIDAQPADQPLFFILKSDGSIRGSHSNPYELVTIPMSLTKHKTYWAHVFDKLEYEKFDRTVDTNNGMHIHVDRNAFEKRKTPALPGRVSHGPSTQGMTHMDKFGYFFINPCNFNFLLKVSERSIDSLNSWAIIPSISRLFFDVDSAVLRGKKPTLENLRKNTYSVWRNFRGTLNYQKSATIEVRMFKGIVSFPTIIKNLEFVDSVMEFTRTTSQYRLNLSHYNEWFYSLPKNKYATLREFYEHINMRARVAEATLMQSIYYYGFREEDVVKGLNKLPRDTYDKVEKIIGKGSFQDISRMNLELEGNTWRTTGGTSRRGILSSLDSVLEKKYLPFKKKDVTPEVVAAVVEQNNHIVNFDEDADDDEENEEFELPDDDEEECQCDDCVESRRSLYDDEEPMTFDIIIDDVIPTPPTPATTYPDDWQPNPALAFMPGDPRRNRAEWLYPPRARNTRIELNIWQGYPAYRATNDFYYFCHNGRYALTSNI